MGSNAVESAPEDAPEQVVVERDPSGRRWSRVRARWPLA